MQCIKNKKEKAKNLRLRRMVDEAHNNNKSIFALISAIISSSNEKVDTREKVRQLITFIKHIYLDCNTLYCNIFFSCISNMFTELSR